MKKIISGLAVFIIALTTLLFAGSNGDSDKGQKICSAVQPGNWRNDLPVGNQWTLDDCKTWMAQQGATGYQVGCLTKNKVIYAEKQGVQPSPNCGW